MKDQTRLGGRQGVGRSADLSRGEAGVRDAGAGCRWFLDVYSDYRDNRLDPCARNLASAHIAACPRCRRYDRVLRTGVAVLRDEEPVPPSGRGLELATLRDLAWQRDRAESQALGMAGSGMTTGGLVLVALVLCAFAWFPLFVPPPVEIELEPVIATAPVAAPFLHPRPLSPLLPAPPSTPFWHPFRSTLLSHSGPLYFPGPQLSFPRPRPPLSADPFRPPLADPALADYGAWLNRPPPGGVTIVVDHD